MNSSDLINGLFELFGGLLLTINCFKLYKDKVIHSVSLLPTTFFTLWGLWNLFFYPFNGLMFSFIGGIIVVAANSVWITMALFYRRKHV